MFDVIREVDRSHPALTEFAFDAVAAFEGCVQTFGRVWHAHALNMRLRSRIREQSPIRTPHSAQNRVLRASVSIRVPRVGWRVVGA